MYISVFIWYIYYSKLYSWLRVWL